jgi:threonine aldolase
LIALEESPAGLAADHANARTIAARLTAMPGIKVFPVETNIVIFDILATGRKSKEISTALKERGVLMNGVNDRLMRAVTHYDATSAQCSSAMDTLASILGEAAGPKI